MQLRYGRRRRPWLLVVFGTALLIGLLVALISVLLEFISPPVRGKLLSFEVISPQQATITWEVKRGSAQDVICALRAQDFYRGDVAYALYPLPADGSTVVRPTFTLNTNDEAFTVEVLACVPEGELIPAAGLQFPMGFSAPAQPAPALVPSQTSGVLTAPLID